MSSNKPPTSQLQRRPGRRLSNPSPTSSGFPRRRGRPSELFGPSDSPGSATHVHSPSLELKLPSPTFDFDASSPAGIEEQAGNDSRPVTRVSDDYGKQRPKLLEELNRPATSSAGLGLSGIATSKQIQSPDLELKSSRGLSSSRDFGDMVTRTASRETQDEGPGPAFRNFSSPAIYAERYFLDEAGTPKTPTAKKSRLNLLNPMSLLARRRTSQNSPKLEESGLRINTYHVPAIPDNFDPSIRGNIVHDFSAPRIRRTNNENSPRPGALPSPGYPRRPSDISPLSQPLGSPTQQSSHSPFFKEHFQDEGAVPHPSNTAFLHNNNLQAPPAGSLPKFAQRLPITIPDQQSTIEEKPLPQPLLKQQGIRRKSLPPEPNEPPPPPPKQPPSPILNLPPASMLPKHMTSSSSRFSFQLGGQASVAQERLLEEKHKTHVLRQPSTVSDAERPVDDDYDNYDFEHEDLEERIPGVNDDFDDDGFNTDDVVVKNIDLPSSQFQDNIPLTFIPELEDEEDFNNDEVDFKNINVPTNQLDSRNGDALSDVPVQSLQDFHFTPHATAFSPTSTQGASEPTPRDAQGFPIGLAESHGMSYKSHSSHSREDSTHLPDEIYLGGLHIRTDSETIQPSQSFQQNKEPFEDSELYFDDGEFNLDATDPGEAFDESWLEDGSNMIQDIPAANMKRYEEALRRSAEGTTGVNFVEKTDKIRAMTQTGGEGSTIDEPRSDVRAKHLQDQAGLTEDNLAAYHDALAMAASKAAEDGKFDRTVSFANLSEGEVDSPFHDSQPGISSNGSRYSNNFHSSGVSDEDAFAFDDDMDDEAMIAAANAEALENDEEGIYGQEFGFYARAYGKDTAEYTNGGYFATRGSNGVKRSHSGKANFQEPSLTPITERSEWSARNSIASLPMHAGIPGSAQSLPSPGIAQLLELDSPLVEDEMTLSALLKLRRGAFGGSSTSINSLHERHNSASSPLAYVSSYKFPPVDSRSGNMSSPTPGMVNSVNVAESDEEEDESDRPTLTQNTPHKKKNVSPRKQPSQDLAVSSPMSRTGGSHHSRTSSGGESISYAREDGRWVLERRRTDEDGQVELIGREYLVGARI